MGSLEWDLDSEMSHLEAEWRRAYEAGILARADYQVLAAGSRAGVAVLEAARQRVDRSEALTASLMAKLERLEAMLLGKSQS